MNNESYRVIVAGSRTFDNYPLLCEKLDYLLSEKKKAGAAITIVCGMAKGADLLGAEYASAHGYNIAEFPAQWEIYGRRAGPVRNEQMAQNADALIAFWDGKSRGTESMIHLAEKYKLKVRIIRYTN